MNIYNEQKVIIFTLKIKNNYYFLIRNEKNLNKKNKLGVERNSFLIRISIKQVFNRKENVTILNIIINTFQI